MSIDKKSAIIALVWFVIGCICGFFMCKGVYDRPIKESIVRDTVTVTDTITRYHPKPVGVEKVRTEYKWLTRVTTDTVTRFSVQHDSVLVEVPITSKHYGTSEYDAYISGYEPNLDSIFVYQKTQLITERVTISKPPNKWSLSVNAGVDYGTTSQFWKPYASGELTINNDKRLQLGIEGGVKKSEVTNNFEPFAGAKLKIKVF